jgi:hypothetical protein
LIFLQLHFKCFTDKAEERKHYRKLTDFVCPLFNTRNTLLIGGVSVILQPILFEPQILLQVKTQYLQIYTDDSEATLSLHTSETFMKSIIFINIEEQENEQRVVGSRILFDVLLQGFSTGVPRNHT